MDKLFEYNFMISMNINGCFHLSNEIILKEDASKKIVDILFPYNKESCRDLINDLKIVSLESAIELSKNALNRCVKYIDKRIYSLKNKYDYTSQELIYLENLPIKIGLGSTCDYNSGECYACIHIIEDNKLDEIHFTFIDKSTEFLSLSKRDKDLIFSNKLLDLLLDKLNYI